MHDIECKLAIVISWSVHPEWLAFIHLSSDHRCFTQNNHAAFTNAQCKALSRTCGLRFEVTSLSFRNILDRRIGQSEKYRCLNRAIE